MAQEISQSTSTKVLSFDDSIMAKPHTKENALNCWHYDHSIGKNVKGVQFLRALFNTNEMNVPLMAELIKKDVLVTDSKTVKTQSNHFYLSIMAYSKVEILKIRTKTNAFTLKD